MKEKVLSPQQEIPPEDLLIQNEDYTSVAQKQESFTPDDGLAPQTLHQTGDQRRKRLNQQIEVLYDRVVKELNNNPKDVAFALDKLKIAQNIILEDFQQYEEALYWVVQVKKMLVQKRNLTRWAYTWGLFVFFYSLIWLIALIAGFFMDFSALFIGGIAGWYSALAGGIGSSVALMYNVSWQVSVKQAFERQNLMKYLIQPVLGFILGTVIFLMTGAGFLMLGRDSFDSPHLIAVQMLLGFVVGFHQQVIFDLIDHIIKKLSPKTIKRTPNMEVK